MSMELTHSKLGKVILVASSFVVLFQVFSVKIEAQLVNPVIGDLGNNPTAAASGSLFVQQFVSIWNSAIAIGAIMTIVMFIWGAVEWISAGSDSSKVSKAQQRMTQAALGLFLLVTSFILIGFVSSLLFGNNFDVLRPQFFVPGS